MKILNVFINNTVIIFVDITSILFNPTINGGYVLYLFEVLITMNVNTVKRR